MVRKITFKICQHAAVCYCTVSKYRADKMKLETTLTLAVTVAKIDSKILHKHHAVSKTSDVLQ